MLDNMNTVLVQLATPALGVLMKETCLRLLGTEHQDTLEIMGTSRRHTESRTMEGGSGAEGFSEDSAQVLGAKHSVWC